MLGDGIAEMLTNLLLLVSPNWWDVLSSSGGVKQAFLTPEFPFIFLDSEGIGAGK